MGNKRLVIKVTRQYGVVYLMDIVKDPYPYCICGLVKDATRFDKIEAYVMLYKHNTQPDIVLSLMEVDDGNK
jgi:hypothetical protein